jgi:hypothetical protein
VTNAIGKRSAGCSSVSSLKTGKKGLSPRRAIHGNGTSSPVACPMELSPTCSSEPMKSAFDLIQRDAFKSAVGRAIFCGHPDCGVILDYRRAVELSACKGPHYVSVKVFCADCADRVRPVIESKLGPLGLRLEVVDGRQFR